MGIQDERDRAASQSWLDELEAAREEVEALGGVDMDPAAERDLDHIHQILDQMRDRELERVDPTKKAAVAVNPLPAFSTITAVREALSDLEFRRVKHEWGKGYLEDCEEAVSMNMRFTVEKVDDAWSLYVTPEALESMRAFSEKMIHRIDDLPDYGDAIEAAESFRAEMIARQLNVSPIKEPDWLLSIEPSGKEGAKGSQAPHVAVWLFKDRANSVAERVHSLYLHQNPSASVFELTQDAQNWADGFRSAMSKTMPHTKMVIQQKPMEWGVSPQPVARSDAQRQTVSSGGPGM